MSAITSQSNIERSEFIDHRWRLERAEDALLRSHRAMPLRFRAPPDGV